MKKSVSILSALLVVAVFVSMAIASGSSDTPSKEAGTASKASAAASAATSSGQTFGLNDTAVFKNLKVTATEIKTSTGSTYLKPSDGNIYVGVNFTIVNTSNKDQVISSALDFDAYTDNNSASESITGASAFGSGTKTIDGKIAPGKQLQGYYVIEAPKTTKVIEIQFKADLFGGSKAVFKFDMPKS